MINTRQDIAPNSRIICRIMGVLNSRTWFRIEGHLSWPMSYCFNRACPISDKSLKMSHLLYRCGDVLRGVAPHFRETAMTTNINKILDKCGHQVISTIISFGNGKIKTNDIPRSLSVWIRNQIL